MTRQVTLFDPPVTVHLRRSARARRLSLRVAPGDGRISLTMPRHAGLQTALDFLNGQEEWLRGALSRMPGPVVPLPGTWIELRGERLQIARGKGRGVRREGDRLLVPGPPGQVPARLKGYLRAQARADITAAVRAHSARLGRPFARLSLRDTRSRWGSCSADGKLMLSWRLIMAPPAVLDYVAAHEVAHLVELNHSPRFWALVERLCPGHAAQRRWLAEHGTALHRYRFDALPDQPSG